MAVIVAVDSGKQGAVARLDTNEEPGRQLKFYDLPLTDNEWDPWKFNHLVAALAICGAERVLIEECHAFPGISAHANAQVMEAYGMWRAAFAAKFLPGEVIIVPSSVWKPAMGLTVKLVKAGKKATKKEKAACYAARKQASLSAARSLFGLPFRTEKGRDMDGEAEAALLALHGSRIR